MAAIPAGMRFLVGFEILAIVAFLGLAVAATFSEQEALPTINAAALAVGPAEERWMGIFLGEAHVGYSVSREAPTADGGRVFRQDSSFRIGAMGAVQEILTGGTAVVAADGTLRSFDFFLSSPVKVFARGELTGLVLTIDLTQGGETSHIELPVREAPVLSLTLPIQLRARGLTPGDSFSFDYFDPITLANQPATARVGEPAVLANGETGYWVTTRYGSAETRRLVDGNGETLREESGGMGLRTERMLKADAMAIDDEDPPDLVALAAAPLEGSFVGDARTTRIVRLRVSGVEASKFASDPPLQVVEGDIVSVSIPSLAGVPSLPVAGEGDTEATFTLPADHREIVERARAVIGDAPDRLEAARRINQFVFEYLQKVPTIGVPNGLEVLRSGVGDCNEHTALFVSLARAVGIPARIAAGLVYSSRLGDAFYYHAWPEVRLGGPSEWVPLDPTFGQFPADATHVKIVNGDLDRQVEIMGLMGNVRLALVEAR